MPIRRNFANPDARTNLGSESERQRKWMGKRNAGRKLALTCVILRAQRLKDEKLSWDLIRLCWLVTPIFFRFQLTWSVIHNLNIIQRESDALPVSTPYTPINYPWATPLGIWIFQYLAVKFPCPSSKKLFKCPWHVKPAGWANAPSLGHF